MNPSSGPPFGRTLNLWRDILFPRSWSQCKSLVEPEGILGTIRLLLFKRRNQEDGGADQDRHDHTRNQESICVFQQSRSRPMPQRMPSWPSQELGLRLRGMPHEGMVAKFPQIVQGLR